MMLRWCLLAPAIASVFGLGKEQTGLLQASSKLRMSRLEQTADAEADLQGILQKLEEDPSFAATNQDQIKTLIDELGTAFIHALNEQHDSDQTAWDAEASKVEQCRSDTAKRFESGGDVHELQGLVTLHRTKHKACRKAEASWSAYKNASESQCPQENALAFFTTQQGDLNVAAALSDWTTDLNAYETTEPIGTLPASCEYDQLQFEANFCAWRASKNLACGNEQSCEAVVGLDALRSKLLQQAASRISHKLNFLKVECRILQLLDQFATNGTVVGNLSDNSSLNDCEAITTPSDELTLNISLQNHTHCNDTSELHTYPSETTWISWKAAEYEVWTNEYILPNAVQTDACAASISPAPAPAVDPNCQDSAEIDECAFFTYHHDACSSQTYQGSTFDPQVHCCICGGGLSTTTTSTMAHGVLLSSEVFALNSAEAYCSIEDNILTVNSSSGGGYREMCNLGDSNGLLTVLAGQTAELGFKMKFNHDKSFADGVESMDVPLGGLMAPNINGQNLSDQLYRCDSCGHPHTYRGVEGYSIYHHCDNPPDHWWPMIGSDPQNYTTPNNARPTTGWIQWNMKFVRNAAGTKLSTREWTVGPDPWDLTTSHGGWLTTWCESTLSSSGTDFVSFQFWSKESTMSVKDITWQVYSTPV